MQAGEEETGGNTNLEGEAVTAGQLTQDLNTSPYLEISRQANPVPLNITDKLV